MASAEGRALAPALIDAVYDAGLGTRSWADALAEVGAAIGAEVSIFALSPENRRPPFGTTLRLTPEEFLDYQTRMMPRDEMLQGMSRAPVGAVVRSELLLDDDAMERTEVYNAIYRKVGFFYFCSATLARSGDAWVVLTAQRPRSSGPLSASECGLFGDLVPHVGRALRIERQLDVKRLAASGAMRCSDAAGLAVILLDEAGAVIDFNQTAARLIGADDSPLRIVEGGVEAVVDGVARRLDPNPAPCSGAGAARRSDGEPTLIRLGGSRVGACIPLGRERREAFLGPSAGPAAAVVVNLAGGDDRPVDRQLAEIYGLTRAEARVAAAVAAGTSIAETATRLGLSRETVRSQLKRVFSKTGTCRQTELALLVWRMPNPGQGATPLPS